MEHISAEKGSALEMVQKVSDSNLIWQYLIILLLYFQIQIFYWQNLINPVLNFQILMTGGFWKFIGDGCCLGQISPTFLAFTCSPFPDRRTDMLIKDAGFSSVAQTRCCKEPKYHINPPPNLPLYVFKQARKPRATLVRNSADLITHRGKV